MPPATIGGGSKSAESTACGGHFDPNRMRCFFQSLMQYFRDLRLVLSAQSEKGSALVRRQAM